jgi:catechol 2,3-dioxygenase
MNFQGVVMNVADLNRSIDFYRDVLGFTLLSQEEQVAALSAPQSDGSQVIVMRAHGNSIVGGAGHIGLRAFMLQVESDDQLEQIATAFDSRRLLINRRVHPEWTAVVGRDPDGVAVVVGHVSGGIAEDRWRSLDEFVYGIGE